jgi:hypothetical protein
MEQIMQVTVYVVSTCIPQDVEPCLPQLFGDEKAAVDAMDAALREEWAIADPHDDAGEALAYPGDPVEACDHLARHFPDGSYGRWEMTSHNVTIPDGSATP